MSLALIMVELVTNAVKYACPNGKDPIWVAVSQAGAELVLSVSDEGCGLPEGFDVRNTKGLGMRIVQALAAQLGAEIEVRRRPKGTEFAVRLPIEHCPVA
ncbi:MAG: sensor histidine kinase [Sphingomonadales bacterium]|nr:sensor histidine kinase [Sphingomonadales bacterium]